MNKEIEKLIRTSQNAFGVKFKPRVKVEIKISVVKVYWFKKESHFELRRGLTNLATKEVSQQCSMEVQAVVMKEFDSFSFSLTDQI